VKSFCLQTLAAALRQKVLPARGYVFQQRLNQLFQKSCVRELRRIAKNERRRTVFAYAYAAREIFACAKERGWQTVLGQIDPGPLESEIVLAEYAKLGLRPGASYQAPPGYWDDWKMECYSADQIVVNSDWAKACLLKSGVPEEKMKVIPCAFESRSDAKNFARNYPAAFTAERPLRVLFLGQTTIRKGIHLLMEAALSLNGEPVHFTIVGDGLDHPSLKIPPNVQWVGPVSRQETYQYYKSADIFILPTLSDGFALVQLEALAWALPIITTEHCGRVVENGKNGILLTELHSSALVQAIKNVMNCPPMLQSMSALAEVTQEYSLAAVGKIFMELENQPFTHGDC
jgi:glycosyltransferase involved in cell wall biosynthesis